MTAKEKARAFLEIAHQFKLGELDTERPHPKTTELSDLVTNDLPRAVGILKEIDLEALPVVIRQEEQIMAMKKDMERVLDRGDRIFLVGCGATGRLSLVLEVLWRKEQSGSAYEDRVISFMAGGDTALIRSIEKFEDFPDYAHRQLMALGFRDGDLLIASTEGGETPFVIGATEKAAGVSGEHPWYLYCNPDEQLVNLTERTNRILNHTGVNRINLATGPMALSGSTRMQASTVLMYAIGLALLNVHRQLDIKEEAHRLTGCLKDTDIGFIEGFIEAESAAYLAGDYLVYETHDDLGICVLTDTTERSPTFSLQIYENYLNTDLLPSLVYLCLPDCADADDAWHRLLSRSPRPLDWDEFPITTYEHLMGFDFSAKLPQRRSGLVAPARLHTFRIWREKGRIILGFAGLEAGLDVKGLSLLDQHLLLKMILNLHSTLVMGKLGRYESNLMTYVRPSNNKLIDRAARYVMILLERAGVQKSYEEVIYQMFELFATDADPTKSSSDTQAIVLKTFDALT